MISLEINIINRSSDFSIALLPIFFANVLIIFLPACSDPDQATTDGGTDGDSGTAQCAAGLRAVGPACAPIFDECKDDEIPVLGGGCRHVGPPKICLMGWARIKGGWCEPILPKTKCPVGTMEVIGKTACQPIGECGSRTWGKIKTTASTIFVDQSYTGGGSDGSQSKPFVTIGAALYKATAGDHIAVAAGNYKEGISIQRKVTLEGRCAQMVTISGGSKYAAVKMTKWASGAVLRGVDISGADTGLSVDGVSVTVERVSVQGCEVRGVQVADGTLTLLDSLVAATRAAGISLFGARANVKRSVVRDTRERAPDKRFGYGIYAGISPSLSKGSVLTLRDSLVAGNRTTGIALWSSKATVERSVVRDTRKRASDKWFGHGIYAGISSSQSKGSDLILRDSLVAGNRSMGIALISSKATVERSVVRDTREQASDNKGGEGIHADIGSGRSQGSELTLCDSLVAGNRSMGIALWSSKATVQRSVVHDTRERASDKRFGTGIQASIVSGQSQGSELTLRDSLVANNWNAGIQLYSSKATVERSVVHKKSGVGIYADVGSGQSQGSELTLRDSLVANNRNVGISLFSSKATMERSMVRDTLKDGFGVYGDGLVAGGKSTLYAMDTTVERNARAGFLFTNSGGSVHRCLIRHNVFSVDLEQGARPTIGKDNLIVDNKENEVTSRGLKIAPPLKQPEP